jgi:TolB protein
MRNMRDYRHYAPSPKGDFLALADATGISISDKLGGDLTKILDVERPWNITWAPNEQYLAFMDYSVSSERHDLFKVERSGNNLTNITKDLPVLEAFSPSWSPIDDRIAFYFSDAEGFKVGIVNSDGSGFSKNADWHISSEFNGFDPTDSIPPQWSPDGRKLLFSSASDSGEDLDLFVVSADGSDLRNLTNSLHVDEIWPVWSPDGRQIAFQSNRDENWEIYVINADGSNPINVSQSPETKDEFPAWRP